VSSKNVNRPENRGKARNWASPTVARFRRTRGCETSLTNCPTHARAWLLPVSLIKLLFGSGHPGPPPNLLLKLQTNAGDCAGRRQQTSAPITAGPSTSEKSNENDCANRKAENEDLKAAEGNTSIEHLPRSYERGSKSDCDLWISHRDIARWNEKRRCNRHCAFRQI